MSSRTVRGNSAISVQVLGLDGIHRAFRPLLEPEITAYIDAANKKGAQGYAKALRPAVGAVSSRMRRAVRVKRAKTGKPGWAIGSKRKVAFFWPFVIGGTRAHGPKRARALAWKGPHGWINAGRVRGVRANAIVERVARDNEARIARDIETQFAKETGL